MLSKIQDIKARNYWLNFQNNVNNLLKCTSRLEVSGTSIKVVWTDADFKVNTYVHVIDFDNFALDPDDFERGFLEKFKKYLEGATNGESPITE